GFLGGGVGDARQEAGEIDDAHAGIDGERRGLPEEPLVEETIPLGESVELRKVTRWEPRPQGLDELPRERLPARNREPIAKPVVENGQVRGTKRAPRARQQDGETCDHPLLLRSDGPRRLRPRGAA